MSLADLFQVLQARAHWQSVGRPLLLKAGFTIHRGYENTFTSALAEPKNPTRTAVLESLLIEYLMVGEKLIRLVKLKSGERDTVAAWVGSKRRAAGTLSDHFPTFASQSAIRAARSAPPQSLGSIDLHSGAAAAFTSARTFVKRVELSAADLLPTARAGYERIYADQRQFIQTFDSVWISPRGSYACLVMDLPRGAPVEITKESQSALEFHLRKLLGRPLEFANFWPAVEGLYTNGDGRLVDYGFATDKEGVNHHTSRRGSTCLREKTYDKAGADAVGDDLMPFKLAMRWKTTQDSEPEVLLPGTAAHLNKANARLDHAIVHDCLNSRDFEFVLSKLYPFVK